MRIFYASDTTPNAAFKSNLWRNNLFLPLKDLGHDVIEFEYDLRETFQYLDTSKPNHIEFIKKNRPMVSKALIEQITNANSIKKIDLFFSYFYDACVLPETIEQIKSLGIKTINWYCNAMHQLHLVSKISPHYDWCMVPEKIRLNDFRALGANPIYSQEAANPNIYVPYDIPYEYDISFIGQAYGNRPEIIHKIHEAGFSIRVCGMNWVEYVDQSLQMKNFFSIPGWKKIKKVLKREAKIQLPANVVGGILSDTEMIKLYSQTKINLGLSGVSNVNKDGVRQLQIRLRDFEVPMSGGFYMVEYMEELEEFFEIGKEIVCYSGADDLIGKIGYYLSHEEEREAIRKAGYQRCLKDHTWQQRFTDVFKLTKLE